MIMITVRRFGWMALAVVALVLWFAGCAENGEERTTRTGPQAGGSEGSVAVDLSSGPMRTFEEACARCHGSQGSRYGGKFYRMSDSKLKREVRGMMFEDAGLKPSDAEITAMTAYHLALRDRRPFVCVVHAATARSDELNGEVTTGSAVRVEKDGVVTEAAVHGFTWQVSSPPSQPFRVIVSKGGTERSFEFPARRWSE